MTRYSNVGLKRKYLEATAQYKEAEPEAGPSSTVPGTPARELPDSTTSEQPAKKKRKRGKPRNPQGETEETAESGEGASPATAAEDGTSKKTKKTRSEKGKGKLKGKNSELLAIHFSRILILASLGVDARKFTSERRRLKRQQDRNSQTICYACREQGHSARFCPKALEGGDGKAKLGKQAVGICYRYDSCAPQNALFLILSCRCGSKKHSLSKCREVQDPENPLPFASCFVCSGKGHLASTCPQNQAKGVYPNGGCCKLCGEKTHLAKDCALRKKGSSALIPCRLPLLTVHVISEVTPSTAFVGTGAEAGADEDDFHTFKRKSAEVGKEEKAEERRKKGVAVKVGAFSGTAQAFGRPLQRPKKVVVF
jgi:zinc finger CCHC domain-containing protein 9